MYFWRHINWLRLSGVALVALYFVPVAMQPYEPSVIASFNLIMHEAGHWIFGLFGMFIGVLGGSLLQLLVPVACLVTFWRDRQYLGSTFSIMWLGQSFTEVAVYAGDAIYMQLPLLGGEAVIHDWNWLLLETNTLHYTSQIATVLGVTGWFCILIGLAYGVRTCWKHDS